jgi:histone acetyltransferase
LNEHENAWPFRQPVPQKQAPDYYNVIKEPMWIERIKEKLKNCEYTEREQFKYDINLIFENAKVYNLKDSFFYKLAEILKTFCQPMLDKLKETKQDAENRKMRS